MVEVNFIEASTASFYVDKYAWQILPHSSRKIINDQQKEGISFINRSPVA